METVNIQWQPKKYKLAQVHDEGLEYAFVSKDWKLVNQTVCCKDFLQDALCAYHNNKRLSIYGFNYDPEKHEPIMTEETRILIANWRDKSIPNRIEGSIDFINQFEETVKLTKKTKILKMANVANLFKASGAWLYQGCKTWMLAPPMLSLYTLLLRISLIHKKGESYKDTFDGLLEGDYEPYLEDDIDFLRCAMPAIEMIQTHGPRKLFGNVQKYNYTATDDLNIMHENCGIVGFAEGSCKETFPRWYKKIEVSNV